MICSAARCLASGAIAAFACWAHTASAARALADWPTISVAEAGFRSDVAEQLDKAVRNGEFRNLHALVVIRHGKLVLERYYAGPDERLGDALGSVRFAPHVKHDLRSSSKSVVSLLYGIALGEGIVPAIDEPLIDHFPMYRDLAANPQLARIKVRHALTMTLGTRWNENVPFNDPRHSEIVMYSAADSNRFVLEQPVVEAPGTRWDYNGGTTQLLGALITRGSGTSLLDYAREKLFEPLSIQDVEWIGTAQSDAAAASGLRLRPRDLAKIGQLVLNAGRWNDRQLVPARWLEQSLQSHVRTPPMNDEGEYTCGYQWGLVKMNGNHQRRIFALPGNGGQRLTIIPELQLVVVIMAGNYNQQGQGQMPTDLMKRIVMGNLLEVSAD